MSDSTESSERALRSLREEAGSSRTPLLNAKVERSLSPPVRPSSPDQTCAICLGEINDKSVTDSCFHRFCFSCLSEWSKVKPECPLCKARFTAIYHGIKSMNDFQVYRLDQSRNLPHSMDALDAEAAAMDPHIFINVAVQRAFTTGRFGYRTTMGLNRTGRGPTGGYIWGHPGHEMGTVPVSLPRPTGSSLPLVHIPSVHIQPPAPDAPGSSRRPARNQRGIEFRKNVYRQNLWARPNPDQDRIRESSPEFYRANLAQTHRLVPWLARELNALSEIGTRFRFEYATRDILQWIRLYPINSVDFKRNLVPYLGSRTDHFVHEFYQYAVSPHDMQGYDNQTRYTPSTAEQEVSQNASDEDDDMEVDHDLPLLPYNLSLHDAMAPLRCIAPIGRPSRNISGRPRGLNSSLPAFDLSSYLFPPVVNRERPADSNGHPEVIVLSSDQEEESSDSDSEVQIIGSLPPLHLRPPEQVIDLEDSNDSDVIEIKPPTPPLIEIDDDNDDDDLPPRSPSAPSTSNGVAGPSGMHRGEGLRSARFFRPSYREYSSSSDDEVLKKKSAKKKSSSSKLQRTRSSKRNRGSKSSKFVGTSDDSDDSIRVKQNSVSQRTSRSSRRLREPKSSKFVDTDDDSDDSIPVKESDDKQSRRKLLKEDRKHRDSKDSSASRASRRESQGDVAKRQSSLPSKILASKNSRKSKADDCGSCCQKRHTPVDRDSSTSSDRSLSKHRKRRKNGCISSDDDSSPRRKKKKSSRSRHHLDSSSSSSKGTEQSSQSSSSSFNEHSTGGPNLARNPKAISKKAMILGRRASEVSSPDGPPAYRYGELVELPGGFSPTYVSMTLDNTERGTAEDSDSPSVVSIPPRSSSSLPGRPLSPATDNTNSDDSRTSTTLSMGTESAPPRHFELPSLHPSYSPLLNGPRTPSSSSLGSSSCAVASSSPPRPNLGVQLDAGGQKFDSPPSIASPSSDSSGSRSNSPAPHSSNSWPELSATPWPELSASQPTPAQSQSEGQTPSSPPNLHRFDDSPIITLDHSPLMTPPHDSSSWNSSSESPSTSPPRLKSVIASFSGAFAEPIPDATRHSDNTTSDDDDTPQ